MLKKSLLFTAAVLAGTSLFAQKDVSVHFVHEYDGQPFMLNTDYTDWAGRTIQFTRAEFYLCEFELTHDGGQTLDLSSEYLLVRHTDAGGYDIGSHNITNLESVSYSIGVDTSVNHDDPALWPIDHPLAMQNPTMHWGWAGGYRFLVLHGLVDVDGDNVAETSWELQAITDPVFTPHSAISTTGHNDGNNLEIWFTVDYSGWLENLNLNIVASTHGAMDPIPEMMSNTEDYDVFTVPVNLSTDELNSRPGYIYVDYTYPTAPQLRYSLPGNENVSMMVTDMTGKVVVNEQQLAGSGRYQIAEGLATGIYNVTLFNNNTILKNEKLRVVR